MTVVMRKEYYKNLLFQVVEGQDEIQPGIR